MCATATAARFAPRRAASRRYWAARSVSLVRAAAGAAATRAVRSQGLPLRVRPLRRLPARSSFPGQRPAQEAK